MMPLPWFLEGLSPINMVAKVLAVSGELIWFVALLLLIRDSVRHRTNAMPVVPLCFALAYELYYAFIGPYLYPEICLDNVGAQLWTWRGWLLLNLVQIYYLVRYGRHHPQAIPVITKNLYSWLAGLFLLGLAGQVTFVPYIRDINGNVGTTFCNLIMSLFYIFLLQARPDLRGLSAGVAWTKMLGSGLINLSMVVHDPFPNPGQVTDSFPYYLFISIFLLDCLYIVLHHRRRAAKPSSHAVPSNACL